MLANPAYGAAIHRPVDIINRMRTFAASGGHVWWDESITLSDRALFNPSHVRGHAQITDVFLLGLATKMGGRLATFDRTIPLSAVVGATEDNLAVVAPAD